jgi:hypothetical protein
MNQSDNNKNNDLPLLDSNLNWSILDSNYVEDTSGLKRRPPMVETWSNFSATKITLKAGEDENDLLSPIVSLFMWVTENASNGPASSSNSTWSKTNSSPNLDLLIVPGGWGTKWNQKSGDRQQISGHQNNSICLYWIEFTR